MEPKRPMSLYQTLFQRAFGARQEKGSGHARLGNTDTWDKKLIILHYPIREVREG